MNNNYCFPRSWDQMISVGEIHEFSDVDNLKYYATEFTLPWGVSITNTEVMTGAWFKSRDDGRVLEDVAYSRWVLSELAVKCTNDVFLVFIDSALGGNAEARPGPDLR